MKAKHFKKDKDKRDGTSEVEFIIDPFDCGGQKQATEE